jgi:hypothetical protein
LRMRPLVATSSSSPKQRCRPCPAHCGRLPKLGEGLLPRNSCNRTQAMKLRRYADR